MRSSLPSGERVRVAHGSLLGHAGAVIRDEADNYPAPTPRDRVWVLLDVGDNPQHFTHAELVEEGQA